MPSRTRASWILAATVLALYSVWYALLVALPTLAAWLASSVAAQRGGSVRVALLSALLVFPLVPLTWEGFSTWNRSRKKSVSKRFLTFTDRLVLRTLAVSLVFLGGVFARGPERVFTALNGRGDWMLDGRHDPRAEQARRAIFALAARTTWLYHINPDKPFWEGAHRGRPRPQPLPSHSALRTEADPHRPGVPSTLQARTDPRQWPQEARLHPLVASITAADEVSPESVGRFFAAHESDHWAIARAAHDYVSDRVAYDVVSYRSGVFPPQDAETTFRSHLSVCAGYAALFEAIGRAAGLTVAMVVGHARHSSGEGMGEGHAWNAVKLDGQWRLVDTTWDAGNVDNQGFHKRFRTEYFLTPPEAFVRRHYPDEARWQLLPSARTEGEYLRTPVMNPEFFAYGLHLRAPDRAESDAHGSFEVVIDNPQRISLLVHVGPPQSSRVPCTVRGQETVTARCDLNSLGPQDVTLFASREPFGTHWSVGNLRVVNR